MANKANRANKPADVADAVSQAGFTAGSKVAWRAALAAIVVILQGCMMVGPDYEKPVIATADEWHSAVVANLDSGADSALWWQQFNDETLNGLIRKAQADNLLLKVAITRIAEAEKIIDAARGGLMPSVDLSASSFRTRSSQSNPPFKPTIDEFSRSFMQVDWEIDFWGKIRRTVESAQASYEASVEDYRDVLVILNANVASQYVTIRTLQKRLVFARENIERQMDTLELVQARRKAELATELDLAQAKLNLSTTESAVPALQLQLALAMHTLSVLCGEHPGALQDLADAIGPIPQPPAVLASGIPADAIRNRPDVRGAERRLAAQTARIGVAKSDLFPTLSIAGAFGYRSLGDALLDVTNKNWSVGPAMLWRLYDGGRIRDLIEIEEVRTERALLDYETSVLDALMDAENALIGFAKERERLGNLQDSVTAASASAGLVKRLYMNGLTDFQNVLDSERTLFNQQDAEAVTQGNVLQNAISVYRAIGGGWVGHEIPELERRAAGR